MTEAEILSQVTRIFRDTLNNKSLTLDHDTTADQVEGWDSLNHLVLINELEAHFSIKFDLKTISSLTTVGDICRYIKQQLNTG